MERDFKGVWIPKDIYLHEGLTPTDKFLLVEIDSLSKNGECFASNEHFSKFLGVSKKHVSRLISKLVQMKLINVDLIYKKGTKEVEKRVITPIRIEADTPPHAGGDPHRMEGDTPHRTEAETPHRIHAEDINTLSFINTSFNNTTINTPNKSINKNTSKELEEEFEHLWNRYPKKQGKKQAKKAFLKARKENVSLEKINSGLNGYINYIQAQNIEPQYIKHGSTWFNGECWEEEYNVIQFRQQRKGFLGLLDELEERGNVIDYPRGNNQNFEFVSNMLPESLQDF